MKEDALGINIHVANQLKRRAKQEALSEAIQPFSSDKQSDKAPKPKPPKPPSPPAPPAPKAPDVLPPAPVVIEPPKPPEPIVTPIVVEDEELPAMPARKNEPLVVVDETRPDVLPDTPPPTIVVPDVPPAPVLHPLIIEEPPETELKIAHVGLEKALAEEVNQVQATFKSWEQTNTYKPNSPLGILTQPTVWLQKAAHNIEQSLPNHRFLGKTLAALPEYAGGFWYSVVHPVKTLWQNAILSEVYDKRNTRFARELALSLKNKELAMSHVEVPPEFVTYALEEGQKRRNKNLLRRLGNSLWDATAGNLGLQSSTQKETIKWLESEQADEFKAKVNEIIDKNLQRQEALASSFTLHDEQIGDRDEMVAREYGEQRQKMTLTPEAQQTLNTNYRNLIRAYHEHPELKAKHVSELNKFLASEEFQSQLTAEQRAFFNQPEFASNILTLAEKVHHDWDRYQQPDTRDEHTGSYFDNLKFDVIIGQGEWHEAREMVKVNEREHALYLELTRRDFPEGTLHLSRAMDTRLKNLGTFDRMLTRVAANPLYSYLLGEALGAIVESMPRMAPRLAQKAGMFIPGFGHLSGPLFAGVSAALGEKKRVEQERRQVSREAAMGYHNTDSRRKEMEETLVQTKSASELYSSVKTLLDRETLTPEQQKELVLYSAQIRARLRLTNLSAKNERVQQNYIDYSDANNADLSAWCKENHLTLEKVLRATVIQAEERLVHDGMSVDDYQHKLNLFTEVISGHLINGAKDAAHLKEALKFVNKRYQTQTAAAETANETEINDLLALMENKGLTIAETESLARKNRNFTLFQIKEMAFMGMKTATLSYSMSPIMAHFNPVTAVTSEITGFLHHKAEGVSHAQIWQELRNGTYKPDYDPATGKFETDLSPLQNTYHYLHSTLLWQRVFGPDTPPPTGSTQFEVVGANGMAHKFVIDGTNPDVRFSGNTLYDNRDEKPIGRIDGNGQFHPLDPHWAERIEPLQHTDGQPGLEINFPTNNGYHVENIPLPGHESLTINVPNGAHLFADGTRDGKLVYDLVTSDNKYILVQDITVDQNGIVDTGTNHPEFEFNIYNHNAGHEAIQSPGEPIHVAGNEFWQAGENVHVVHGKSEHAEPITNYIVHAEGGNQVGHENAVKFLIPESNVHNPNTGGDVNLGTMNAEGKVGLLFQTVELNQGGSEVTKSHFIAADREPVVVNGKTYFQVILDPSDNNAAHTVHLDQPVNGQHEMQAGAFAQLVLNEKHLAEVANPDLIDKQGEQALNSEMTYEGRAAFALGHQQVGNKIIDGRILGGVKDGSEFLASHAIHGSADINNATVIPPETTTPEPTDYQLELTGHHQEAGTPTITHITAAPIERAFPPLGGLYTYRRNLELAEKTAAVATATAAAVTPVTPPAATTPPPANTNVPPTPEVEATNELQNEIRANNSVEITVNRPDNVPVNITVPRSYREYLNRESINPDTVTLVESTNSVIQLENVENTDKIKLGDYEFNRSDLRTAFGFGNNVEYFWRARQTGLASDANFFYLPIKTADGHPVLLHLDYYSFRKLREKAMVEAEIDARNKERIAIPKQIMHEPGTELAYASEELLMNNQAYDVTLATDRAVDYKGNEDELMIDGGIIGNVPYNCIAVFHDLGGSTGHGKAGQLAASTLRTTLQKKAAEKLGSTNVEINDEFLKGICAEFSEELKKTLRTQKIPDAGASMTAILNLGNQTFVLHAGDTRLYLYRDDNLTLETVDDNPVYREYHDKKMTIDDAMKKSNRLVVDHFVPQTGDKISITNITAEMTPDTTLLLTSSGLPEALDERYSETNPHLKDQFETAILATNPAEELVLIGKGQIREKIKDNLSAIVIKPR